MRSNYEEMQTDSRIKALMPARTHGSEEKQIKSFLNNMITFTTYLIAFFSMLCK